MANNRKPRDFEGIADLVRQREAMATKKPETEEFSPRPPAGTMMEHRRDGRIISAVVHGPNNQWRMTFGFHPHAPSNL